MTELPATKEWAVEGVRAGKVEDNPQGPGQLQKFYVDFEGCDDVYWRRKLPATVEVGQSYFGTITENQYGKMFKKEKPQQGSTTTAGGANHRDWKPESERDPERSARILRQHSQEMALRWIHETKLGGEGMRLEELPEIVNWFDADVNKAGQEAAQGAGSLPAPARPPAPAEGSPPAARVATVPEAVPQQGSGSNEDHQTLCRMLEISGLRFYGASKLVDLILEDFTPSQLEAVKKQLGNFDTQADAFARLKKYYETKRGEPVPEEPPDDDIPF